MGTIWTREFWLATTERVIGTAAQAALGVLGAGAVGILDVDWPALGSIVALAALASLLKCVVAGVADPTTGPAATSAEAELTSARMLDDLENPAGRHRT